MTRTGLEKLRILVVDDNHHMIEIIKLLLRGFGVRDIYEARNAKDGFDLFRSQRIDILFTDFSMPGANGRDLIRRIRTSPDSPNRTLPIVMLSAYAERSNVEAAREVGVTEFCAKPVTATELYSKLVAVVNRQRTFVRTATFFGPDRRRHREEVIENERRAGLAPAKTDIDFAEADDLPEALPADALEAAPEAQREPEPEPAATEAA